MKLRRERVLFACLLGAAACGPTLPADAVYDAGLPRVNNTTDATTEPVTGMDGSAPVDAAPSPSCDVRDFGAKGDGVTKDTVAIQAAIDACADKNGVVHLPAGKYLSAMIHLKSAMTFSIDSGATLLGSNDDTDYPDTNPATNNTQLSSCKKALVYAENVHDLHVTGTGTIDGQGTVAKWATPVEATRPMAMFIVLSQNIVIDSISIKDSGMWSLVNMENDNVTIQNVNINSTHGNTRDGIDVVDCHHVLVDSCTIESEDDSICLKSGVARGLDDVTVKNCHVRSSGVANGLKMGTASFGSVTNVTFDTIDINHSDKAAMAVESVDGSIISNINFKNITFHDVGTPFFVLVGNRGIIPQNATRSVGSIDNVHFTNITGDTVRHEWGSVISGLSENGTTYPITNLSFDNVQITSKGGMTTVPADPPEYAGQYPDPNLWGDVSAWGLFLRHVSGITFTNTAINWDSSDARSLVRVVDVTGFSAPQSTVTFTLRTDVGQPTFDAAHETFRILGRTVGLDTSDPLGGWVAANGITLAPTTPDSTGRPRFTAQATIPQSALLLYKAVVVAQNGTLTYERNGQGNRQFNVPAASTSAVSFDWQN